MTRAVLKGINGSNPLGFMAAVGLLRLLHAECSGTCLGFNEDGTFCAWIKCDPALDIPGIVVNDAENAAELQPWLLTYDKQEKRRSKIVADLKAPPERFSEYLSAAIEDWLAAQPERADYAAAYGTDVVRDNKGNTKPTAFHFTAANQQFLGAVEETRAKITREWVEDSLHDRDGKTRPGTNLRWDPDAERKRALMGVDPTKQDTTVDAPLEWLAFRGLPAFPSVPIGSRVVTCGVTGRHQNEFRFHWPLWSSGASYSTVRSLLLLTAGWIEEGGGARRMEGTGGGSGQPLRYLNRLEGGLERTIEERRRRSVFAICTSEIRRTAQGFGSFGPADVQD